MSRALRAIAYTWSTLVVLLTFAVWVMIYRRSPSLWAFWRQMQEMLVPWNGLEAMKYYFTTLVLLSPAFPLVVAAERLDRGQTTKGRALLYTAASIGLAVIVVYVTVVLVQGERKAAKAEADERVREYKTDAVRILNRSATMHEHRNYIVTQISGPVGKEGIPDLLHLGDTVVVRGKTIKVNHIFVKQYLTDMQWGRQVLAKAGDVKCIVVESEENLPYGEERRSRLWINIEQCQPILARSESGDASGKSISAQLKDPKQQDLTCSGYIALPDDQKISLAYGYLEGVQAALDKEITDVLVAPSDAGHPVWWVLPAGLGDKPFAQLAEKLAAYCGSSEKRPERLLPAFLALAHRKDGRPSLGISYDRNKTDAWKKFLGGSVSCDAFVESRETTRDAIVYGYYLGTQAFRVGLKMRDDVGIVWPVKSSPQSMRVEAEKSCAKERSATVRDVLWLTTAERAVREK